MSDSRSPMASSQRKQRLIKRYANRKMYDTERSCYITLEEVADMVRAGEDLRVIDNKSKDDLTEVTLTQALLNSEKKRRGSVSIDSLRHLFAQGGELLQNRVGAPVQRAASEAERTVEKWRSEAERKVGRVLKKDGTREGENTAEDVARPKAVEPIPSGEPDVLKRTPPRLVESTQRAYDEWQTRMDERVRVLVAALTAPAQPSDELVRLRKQVAELQSRVEKLESAANNKSDALGRTGENP